MIAKIKIRKPIKKYLDLFTKTNLRYISIIFHLVSQPNNKLISNSEQKSNYTDLLSVAFGIIYPPNSRGKNSTNFHMHLGTTDEF